MVELKTNNPRCLNSNTEELILLLVNVTINLKIERRIVTVIESGIDWIYFLRRVKRSGMTFLYYRNLMSSCLVGLTPAHVIDELKINLFHIFALQTTLKARTDTLLELFLKSNIPVIPLKGPLLSDRLYGDISARGISIDIDLLVEIENIEKAGIILATNGYSFQMNKGCDKDRLWQYQYKKNGSPQVDLHWEINSSTYAARRMEGFWMSAEKQVRSGICFYELPDEELLLQLSAHLVDSSYFLELRYICDINMLISVRGNSFDWERVVDKAKEWRLDTSLYASLMIIDKLFETCIPGEILSEIEPGFFKRSIINIFTCKEVFLKEKSIRAYYIRFILKYFLFQLLEAKGIRELLSTILYSRKKVRRRLK